MTLADSEVCPDCGGRKKSSSRRCHVCWREAQRAAAACPGCGGRKKWSSQYCRACRLDIRRQQHRKAAPPCPDCGGPKSQGRVARCMDCNLARVREESPTLVLIEEMDHLLEWGDDPRRFVIEEAARRGVGISSLERSLYRVGRNDLAWYARKANLIS